MCDVQIVGQAFYAGEFEHHLCETCVETYVREEEAAAKEFANEHCKITSRFPEYDDENEFRCTPEEYEMGERASNTPNAYFTKCRHECTNYDELIQPFPKESDEIADHVFYSAISRRIARIVIDEIEARHPNVCLDAECDFGFDD